MCVVFLIGFLLVNQFSRCFTHAIAHDAKASLPSITHLDQGHCCRGETLGQGSGSPGLMRHEDLSFQKLRSVVSVLFASPVFEHFSLSKAFAAPFSPRMLAGLSGSFSSVVLRC